MEYGGRRENLGKSGCGWGHSIKSYCVTYHIESFFQGFMVVFFSCYCFSRLIQFVLYETEDFFQ